MSVAMLEAMQTTMSMEGEVMAGRIFLTTDLVGGVWQYALDLAKAYAAQGLAVDLAVLGPPSFSPRLDEAADLPNIEIVETGLPLDWTAGTPADAEAASAELSRLARRCGADIVHLNSAGLGCACDWPAPLVVALHSCVASWWRTVKQREVLPDDFLWRTKLVAEALRNADAVIAPTRAFAALAAEIYGGDLPWKPIHNGRNQCVRVDMAAKNGSVFSCGRLWDEGKNMTALDEAAGLLDRPVEVAGSARHPDGDEVSFRHLRLFGELSSEDVRARLAHARVFVSTALYEPFGLGVLEAAQAGCALVLADIPTFREIWADAAVFVDPRDPEAIARAIERLASSPEECLTWSERAHSRAAVYTNQEMARATLSLYADILDRQVAGAA